VTLQPDDRMADEAMIDETLPDDSLPDESLPDARGPVEPLVGQPLPGEPLPGEPLVGQPLPGEPLPPEPLTGASAIEAADSDLIGANGGGELSSGTSLGNGTGFGRGTGGTGPAAGGRLSAQWHDIQAMFVDDPQASVERAAQAAEAAVSALVESLRQLQASVVPARMSSDADDADPGSTEQLREALREYRLFCQRVADLQEQLPRAGVMAT